MVQQQQRIRSVYDPPEPDHPLSEQIAEQRNDERQRAAAAIESAERSIAKATPLLEHVSKERQGLRHDYDALVAAEKLGDLRARRARDRVGDLLSDAMSREEGYTLAIASAREHMADAQRLLDELGRDDERDSGILATARKIAERFGVR